MGRIEKAIVLSVLLGVILILAVSMDLDGAGETVPDVPPATDLARGMDPGLDPNGPRRPDLEKERKQGADPAWVTRGPEKSAAEGTALEESPKSAPTAMPGMVERQPGALLSSEIEQAGRRSEPDAAAPESAIPADSALVTLEGLEATHDVGYMKYRWSVGDNFAELAERFYGNVDYVSLLHRANEGAGYLAEGDEILVPVFDRMGIGEVAEPKTAPVQVAADGEYVVREGDNLWTISRKTLGKGSRWREIHQLNIDQLPAADAVRPGMVLRLPAQ